MKVELYRAQDQLVHTSIRGLDINDPPAGVEYDILPQQVPMPCVIHEIVVNTRMGNPGGVAPIAVVAYVFDITGATTKIILGYSHFTNTGPNIEFQVRYCLNQEFHNQSSFGTGNTASFKGVLTTFKSLGLCYIDSLKIFWTNIGAGTINKFTNAIVRWSYR